MTLPTGNQVKPLLMPETADASADRTTKFMRRWFKPRALAVLAITAGSLGLTTSAFADSTGSAVATPSTSAQALFTPTLLEADAPLVVYVANASRLIIEVTPSGALVIFLRPAAVAAPAPAVTAVAIKPRIASAGALRPNLAAVPAIAVTSTSAQKSWKKFDPRHRGYCSHWGWQVQQTAYDQHSNNRGGWDRR
jgi:hypothetical protein